MAYQQPEDQSSSRRSYLALGFIIFLGLMYAMSGDDDGSITQAQNENSSGPYVRTGGLAQQEKEDHIISKPQNVESEDKEEENSTEVIKIEKEIDNVLEEAGIDIENEAGDLQDEAEEEIEEILGEAIEKMEGKVKKNLEKAGIDVDDADVEGIVEEVHDRAGDSVLNELDESIEKATYEEVAMVDEVVIEEEEIISAKQALKDVDGVVNEAEGDLEVIVDGIVESVAAHVQDTVDKIEKEVIEEKLGVLVDVDNSSSDHDEDGDEDGARIQGLGGQVNEKKLEMTAEGENEEDNDDGEDDGDDDEEDLDDDDDEEDEDGA